MKKFLILIILLIAPGARGDFVTGYILGTVLAGDESHPEEYLAYKLDEKVLAAIGNKSCQVLFSVTSSFQKIEEYKKHYQEMKIKISSVGENKYKMDLSDLTPSCNHQLIGEIK